MGTMHQNNKRRRVQFPVAEDWHLEEHPYHLGEIWLTHWSGNDIEWCGRAVAKDGKFTVTLIIEGEFIFIGCFCSTDQAIRALWMNKERTLGGIRMAKKVVWDAKESKFEVGFL